MDSIHFKLLINLAVELYAKKKLYGERRTGVAINVIE